MLVYSGGSSIVYSGIAMDSTRVAIKSSISGDALAFRFRNRGSITPKLIIAELIFPFCSEYLLLTDNPPLRYGAGDSHASVPHLVPSRIDPDIGFSSKRCPAPQHHIRSGEAKSALSIAK
jgi:hypothetical protein